MKRVTRRGRATAATVTCPTVLAAIAKGTLEKVATHEYTRMGIMSNLKYKDEMGQKKVAWSERRSMKEEVKQKLAIRERVSQSAATNDSAMDESD